MVSLAVMLLLAGCNQAGIKGRRGHSQRPADHVSQLDRAIAAQFPNAPLNANVDQTTQLRLEPTDAD